MQNPARRVERLFPFVSRSRILMVGRDTLARYKSKLHFVLITHDLSETSRVEILSDFRIIRVQQYTSKELERHFGINGAKVTGFKKSGFSNALADGRNGKIQVRNQMACGSPNSAH